MNTKIHQRFLWQFIGLWVVMLVYTNASRASVHLFINDQAGFNAAVAGLSNTNAQVIDFESQFANTVISAGSTIQGVTFNPVLEPPVVLAVRGIGGTSGQNILGASSNNGVTTKQLELGDVIDFSLSQGSHAFGMYIVTQQNFNFFADDITISFAGTTVTNPIGTVGTTVNGVNALFLGIVDDMNTHTSASIQFGPTAGAFGAPLFEIDDINFTTPSSSPAVIPEPTSLIVWSILGCIFITVGWRRRKTVV